MHKLNLLFQKKDKWANESKVFQPWDQLLPPTELFLHSAWVCRAILLSDCMKTSFEKLINLFILLETVEKKIQINEES